MTCRHGGVFVDQQPTPACLGVETRSAGLQARVSAGAGRSIGRDAQFCSAMARRCLRATVMGWWVQGGDVGRRRSSRRTRQSMVLPLPTSPVTLDDAFVLVMA